MKARKEWFFWAGDTITSFMPGHGWFDQKVKVEAMTEEKLWGRVPGNSFLSAVDDPLGLALLERKNYAFKVGDELIVQDGRVLKNGLRVGGRGRVIVINPLEGIIFPFLAEFDNFEMGQDGLLCWSYPWFPQQFKTICINRLWLSGREEGISKLVV